MASLKFTRNKDYSDEADANAGGRDTVDPAGLDGEMDEVLMVTDDHADRLDLLLRADLKMTDGILQGHEFSATALSVLGALLGLLPFLNWKGTWVTGTDYVIGDLVYDNIASTYTCLIDHTSGVLATDISAGKLVVFAAGAAAGLPSPLVVNKVLSSDGLTLDWRPITTTEAPTLAPLASPVLTGDMSAEKILLKNRVSFTLLTSTFSAGGNAFDFNTNFMKRVAVTGNYTSACTGSNYTVGRAQEIHFDNTSGAAAALLWDASWVWMGYAPSSLATGKKAVLSLRCIHSAAAAGTVAMWSVEP